MMRALPAQFSRWRTAILIGFSAGLLLSACANQYRAPAGEPQTWGEQHYLDNQRYQETIDQQQSD